MPLLGLALAAEQDLAERAARGDRGALKALEALAQRDSEAKAHLGTLYLLGRGVSPNLEAAYSLYKASADTGNLLGLLGTVPFLYYGIPPAPYDPKRAGVLLDDLANAGLPEAQATRAYYATLRTRGTRLSAEEAADLWKRLAPKSTCAKFYLGRAHLLGAGADRDTEKGKSLLEEAIPTLSPCAAMAAGYLATGYLRGWWGLPQDPPRAWSLALKDTWSPFGAGVRGEYLFEKERLEEAKRQVEFWAFRGVPGLASTTMGRILMREDPTLAAAYLMVALLGDSKARLLLDELRTQGLLTPEGEAKARKVAEDLYAGKGPPRR